MSAKSALRLAAAESGRIGSLTHTFYEYPARFSPRFARTAIEQFSDPGDVVLDPFMGGGTTPVEALALGRRVVGSDLNELAVFVARVKTSLLTRQDRRDLLTWSADVVPELTCAARVRDNLPTLQNMNLRESRWLKKIIAIQLESIEDHLNSRRAHEFARCVVLSVGQWALNSKARNPSVSAFRQRVSDKTVEMIDRMDDLRIAIQKNQTDRIKPVLLCTDAASMARHRRVRAVGLADLVVTSPPYPGVHILYHRWQVDGRKETNAPYWIANCRDGHGFSHYNFRDTRRGTDRRYFEKAEQVYRSLRECVRDRAHVVQLLSFSDPRRQLDRFLYTMEVAGFVEARVPGERRIWRRVPNRVWHAVGKGAIGSAREVVLVHQAV